eukprot:GFYU01022224.1.p1 GENE.GFYU01022224.1~~GFYU01022224.1.p1  ORF type:complete len:619 (+),score=135.50 GFYU01022224.1:58-1914(+)
MGSRLSSMPKFSDYVAMQKETYGFLLTWPTKIDAIAIAVLWVLFFSSLSSGFSVVLFNLATHAPEPIRVSTRAEIIQGFEKMGSIDDQVQLGPYGKAGTYDKVFYGVAITESPIIRGMKEDLEPGQLNSGENVKQYLSSMDLQKLSSSSLEVVLRAWAILNIDIDDALSATLYEGILGAFDSGEKFNPRGNTPSVSDVHVVWQTIGLLGKAEDFIDNHMNKLTSLIEFTLTCHDQVVGGFSNVPDTIPEIDATYKAVSFLSSVVSDEEDQVNFFGVTLAELLGSLLDNTQGDEGGFGSKAFLRPVHFYTSVTSTENTAKALLIAKMTGLHDLRSTAVFRARAYIQKVLTTDGVREGDLVNQVTMEATYYAIKYLETDPSWQWEIPAAFTSNVHGVSLTLMTLSVFLWFRQQISFSQFADVAFNVGCVAEILITTVGVYVIAPHFHLTVHYVNSLTLIWVLWKNFMPLKRIKLVAVTWAMAHTLMFLAVLVIIKTSNVQTLLYQSETVTLLQGYWMALWFALFSIGSAMIAVPNYFKFVCACVVVSLTMTITLLLVLMLPSGDAVIINRKEFITGTFVTSYIVSPCVSVALAHASYALLIQQQQKVDKHKKKLLQAKAE